LRSLERRLVLGLGGALLLVFLFLFWGSLSAVRSLAEAHVLTRLEHDAEALVSAFGPTPRGQLRLREGRVTPIYQQPLSGHYFVFVAAGGEPLRSRSLWDESVAVAPLAPGEVDVRYLRGPGDQYLLVRTAGYEKAGRRFTLLVAEDLTPMAQRPPAMARARPARPGDARRRSGTALYPAARFRDLRSGTHADPRGRDRLATERRRTGCE
jgi:hypothetical protein